LATFLCRTLVFSRKTRNWVRLAQSNSATTDNTGRAPARGWGIRPHSRQRSRGPQLGSFGVLSPIGSVFRSGPIFKRQDLKIGFVWRGPVRRWVAAANASLSMMEASVERPGKFFAAPMSGGHGVQAEPRISENWRLSPYTPDLCIRCAPRGENGGFAACGFPFYQGLLPTMM